jgi:hypothetical protein
VFSKLSERVHSSLGSAARSFFHQSLEHPGLLATTPFGRLSSHAPSTMRVAYDYISFHVDLFIACIMQELITFKIDFRKRDKDFRGLVAHWNLFQEVAHLFQRDFKRLERVLKLE